MHTRRSARRLLSALAVTGALLAAPRLCRAGVIDRNIDFVQLTPFVGAEALWIGSGSASGTTPTVSQRVLGPALTYGGLLGARLGPFSAAILLQRTEAGIEGGAAHFDRVYGHVGLHVPIGPVVLQLGLMGGLAFADRGGNAGTAQGYGGGLSLAVDVFPLAWLSLGVGGMADAQVYTGSSGADVVGGASLTGRLGLHF
jgi:hypothetical protein